MIRAFFFWLHLAAGIIAGLVVLVMSLTGVALTYERQLLAASTAHLRSQPPAAGASALRIETLLARVAEARPDVSPTGVILHAGADAPVVLQTDPAPLYVDAYTGQVLGERPRGGMPAFLATLRSWHRWLAMDPENRAIGRAVTGWSNLIFLFIVLSGIYLWLPRTWTWRHVAQVAFFTRHPGTSKARDFNWHHVIGIWSALPLAIVVLGAVPISFPWASDLVYRAVGDEPPARRAPEAGRRGAGPGGPDARPQRAPGRGALDRGAADNLRTPLSWAGLDVAVERATAERADWQTIAARFPRRDDEPFALTVDRGDGGQPQLRSTVIVDRHGQVVARESFGDQSPGRRLRSVLRFAHTGEVLGLIGQSLAGLVSAGAVVMVWTGLALTWRRFRAWRARPARTSERVPAGSEVTTS